jgi:intracellular septation protein
MKFLFDLFPVILFFIVFKWADGQPGGRPRPRRPVPGRPGFRRQASPRPSPIMLATVVGIVATVLQIGYLLARGRKVDGMLWLSLGVIAVFGGATIYFHDENFIKWKPTILYWVFAAGPAGGAGGLPEQPDAQGDGRADQAAGRGLGRVGYAWMAFFVPWAC